MKKVLLIFISVSFVVCGCGSVYRFMDKNKLMQVHIGMSKTEVQELFGTPGYRTMKGNEREEWKYRYEPVGGHDILQFVFHRDTVESFETWFVPENSLVPAKESAALQKKAE